MDSTDKYSGAVVGQGRGAAAATDAAAAHAGAGVDEILFGAGGELLLPFLDAADGSLRRQPAVDPAGAIRRVVQMGQMASMLRDRWRCEQYGCAVHACISEYRRLHGGRAPHVLDIGAGTGLLSLLAATGGAASVVGVEQWAPMCAIARDVLACNTQRLGGCVPRLLNAHSSELRVAGPGGACAPAPLASAAAPVVEQHFGIIVSEIVDSMLLGEGMVPALRHAYAELCGHADPTSPPPMCVPRSAVVYAQLVHCPLAALWHCTDGVAARPPRASAEVAGNRCGSPRATGIDSSGPRTLLVRTDWSAQCAASGVAIPVHLAQVPGVRAATGVFEAARFDFSPAGLGAFSADREPLRVPVCGSDGADVPAERGANAVVFWWSLELWPGVSYSTAPDAAAHQGWQDHWVQCLLPLPRPVHPGPSGRFTVVVSTPEGTRISFDVGAGGAEVWPSKYEHKRAIRNGLAAAVDPACPNDPPIYLEPQPCTCGLHSACNPDRRWMLRDEHWVGPLRAGIDMALKRAVGSAVATKTLSVVCLGDSALCAALAATSPAWEELHAPRAHAPVLLTMDTTLQGAVHADRVLCQISAEADGITSDTDQEPVLPRVALLHSVCEWDSSTPIAPAVAAALAEAYSDEVPQPPGTSARAPPPIDILVTEPFFSQLQQRPLWCAYAALLRCAALAPLLAPAAIVVPSAAFVYAQAVRFRDLHQNHGPVGAPCGFNHAPFDSIEVGYDCHVFSYPLWQYAYDLVGATQPVLALDFAGVCRAGADKDRAAVPLEQQLAWRGQARLSACTADGVVANAVVLYVSYDSGAGAFSTWHPGSLSPWRQDVVFVPSVTRNMRPATGAGGGDWLDIAVGFSVEAGEPDVTVVPVCGGK